MPNTITAWAMFTFFAGGALGGWVLLALVVREWLGRTGE